MTFETQPPGLTLELDTAPFQSPSTVTGVVNATRTIGTFDQQGPDGAWYQFVSWSDGESRVHTITTPPTPVTYTADFVCEAPEVPNLRIDAERLRNDPEYARQVAEDTRRVLALTSIALRKTERAAIRGVLADRVSTSLDRVPIDWAGVEEDPEEDAAQKRRKENEI